MKWLELHLDTEPCAGMEPVGGAAARARASRALMIDDEGGL